MTFTNIQDGIERRTASLMRLRYYAQIATWQRDADKLNGAEHVELKDYLDFSQGELDEFTTLSEFRFTLQARRYAIDTRVTAMRNRMAQREAARVARQSKRKRGRPRLGLLTYGQYVYFAIAFNHGYGADFEGYGAGGAEPSPAWEPTHIRDWAGMENQATFL